MTNHAKGTFDVKTTPLSVKDSSTTIARLGLDKQYHGGLIGTGNGEMLASGDPKTGSGAYVAIERFTGDVEGRKGSFMLQHAGTLNHGAQKLLITIVPDSGTDDLKGITGTLSIEIKSGQHLYDLEYTIPVR